MDTFFFGGKQFPIRTMNRHIFLMGGTGSGKSTKIRLMLQGFLPEVGKHADEGGYRAFLYDPKWDLVSVLRGMGLAVEPRIVNPFRLDTAAWDMAKDITDPASALAMATIQFPVEKGSPQPFWAEASRGLCWGAYVGLDYVRPLEWTPRHHALVMRDENLLRQILLNCPTTSHLVPLYLSSDKSESDKITRSLMATIASKMAQYEIVYSLWDHAMLDGYRFTLTEFVESEQILLWGNEERARDACDCIFRALVARMSQLLLSQMESEKRRTVICLDELREAGGKEPLNGLHSLLVRGRSYGVVNILACQGIDGLIAVYGKDVTSEVISQCAFNAFLGVSDFGSAEFASKQLGEQEVIDIRRQVGQSVSQSLEGPTHQDSRGNSEQLRQRVNVAPFELMELPPAGARNGISGFYRTPYGSFSSTVDFVPLLKPEKHAAGMYGLRPREHQFLRGWEEGELAWLGLEADIRNRQRGSSSQSRDLPQNPNRPKDRRRKRNDNEGPLDDTDE